MLAEVVRPFNPSIVKDNAGNARCQDQPGIHVFHSTVRYIQDETYPENTKAENVTQ